jgi:hypothetical protein
MTVRDFLQKLGTDALRNGLHPNVWVNALMADYTSTGRYGYDENKEPIHDYPNWIITDVRFKNEAEKIKELGGQLWRVKRVGFGPVNDHVSESELDGYKVSQIFVNNGTLEDLEVLITTRMRNAFPK